MWEYWGQQRPPFAEEPGPERESVWDYPRPPVLQPTARTVRVEFAGRRIAESRRCLRLLETASPPTFYLPCDDADWSLLTETEGRSICEWKGVARYWALVGEPGLGAVAWSYAAPVDAYRGLRRHLAFYPGKVDCFVDEERVRPQPGKFYGGWVTNDVAGPFKGLPGTGHW